MSIPATCRATAKPYSVGGPLLAWPPCVKTPASGTSGFKNTVESRQPDSFALPKLRHSSQSTRPYAGKQQLRNFQSGELREYFRECFTCRPSLAS